MTDGIDWKHVQTIFGEALDQPPNERIAFVAKQCGDDNALLAEVESLLRHHEQSGDEFLRPPPSAQTVPPSRGDYRGVAPHGDADAPAKTQPAPPPSPPCDGGGDFSAEPRAGRTDPVVGREIGGFRIQRAIASGGMGTVYLAEQQQPHRLVALKLLRAGIASESALRRFEYESEILARLRHPNIAEVYEAGTYVGLPYFVMEYIADARTITDYAAAGGLSHRDRLRLFEQVCEAVHYGHQRGVIHRDLKPGNILVDADGRVRVIDFGVARATDADIALTTLHTGTGELVGTLQYMSPEQCDADPHEIDVRSDVYSLGVVLYELLCGRLPYEVGDLAVASAARVICERVPPRPSSVTGRKSSATGKRSRATVPPFRGDHRGVRQDSKPIGSSTPEIDPPPTPPFEGGEYSTPVRGDLERIVLKSLEKDRRQRYQSAADLLRDIRHYQNREPIEARPPTVWTRTLQWVARHPAWATTVTCLTIAATVFAGTWGSVWWYNREPYKLLLCTAAGNPVSRQQGTPETKAVEARLIARSNAELANWNVSDTGCLTGGRLVDRPPEFGGGKLVVLAFTGALTSYPEFGNALVAFDPDRGFEHPVWAVRPEDGEQLPVPAYAPDRRYNPDDFNTKILAVHDIFLGSEHPGAEVIVYHGTEQFSQRILRIYDLRGKVLYQVWHDGGIDQCYWMENDRLLIFTGTNGEKRWDEMGYSGIDMAHPRIVFAIRPEAESIESDFLRTQQGEGPLHPAWYRWFAPPGPFGNDDRPVVIHLQAPSPSRRGGAARISVLIPSASGAGVCWEIDNHGREITDTRLPSDNYKQNSNELPDPNVLELRPWPPPLRR